MLLTLLPPYVFVISSVTDTVTINPLTVAPSTPPTDPAELQQQANEMIERFELTPEQVDRLNAIEVRNRDQIAALNQAVQQGDREITTLLISNATPEVIRQRQSEVAILKQQLSDILFSQVLEMREVFTPAQRQEMATPFGMQQSE
ncbi:MAG: hypothetical protein HC895_24930 [Leptolyngbyaceae cyanobacterium SM1_3_5]|nr:hypothetical protein [Leptolyngbyaceae cyanobacterium SM1_3_5]